MRTAVALALFCLAADWRRAEPGWRYEFPRDHHVHEEFKTEWWYFTGNLFDDAGARFGYQLTFFRQGIRPPAARDPEMSRFVVGDLKFAHFTITDVAGKQFRFEQETSRGAFGEAGFGRDQQLAWIDDWRLTLESDGAFDLSANMKDVALRLRLHATQSPIVHGKNGLSVKASVEGHASHYYSLTRLATSGHIIRRGKSSALRGESWFDHEWATNQLAPGQVGWDWLSVQFDGGGELMLYRMRLENGQPDPSSSGTLISNEGVATHLPGTAFRMTPEKFWKSETTSATYPIAWQIEVPEERLQFKVRAVVENQELALDPLAYWEGAIDVEGTRDGRPLKGRGYLELTGYAAPLRELQR